jgi:hypothetical protein
MCFSATASFVTAGVTGAIGIASLTRVHRAGELPLAAMPIFFGVQQGIEGLLWLTLPAAPDGRLATGLTLLFLIFAEAFWPVYMPLTALLIEPNERRRRQMLVLLAVGAATAVFLLWNTLAYPHGAIILDDHIVYEVEYKLSPPFGLIYLAATSLSLLLSSRRTIVVLGGVVLLGGMITFTFYREWLESVWCFFAAIASAIILSYFEQARRRRLTPAAA